MILTFNLLYVILAILSYYPICERLDMLDKLGMIDYGKDTTTEQKRSILILVKIVFSFLWFIFAFVFFLEKNKK